MRAAGLNPAQNYTHLVTSPLALGSRVGDLAAPKRHSFKNNNLRTSRTPVFGQVLDFSGVWRILRRIFPTELSTDSTLQEKSATTRIRPPRRVTEDWRSRLRSTVKPAMPDAPMDPDDFGKPGAPPYNSQPATDRTPP